MPDWKKDNALRKNAVRFIEAACSIIESDGLDAISIRKVAEIAGFHNSTIYTYFRDSDELTQFACIRYLAPYASKLARISALALSDRETFFRIWEAYFTEAFSNPQIFYLLFFGKYSDDLSGTMALYYELFPEEVQEWTEIVENMYFGHNYETRCMNILKPLTGDAQTKITAENVEAVNRLIVGYTKGMLEKQCDASPPTGEEATRECMSMLHFIVDR